MAVSKPEHLSLGVTMFKIINRTIAFASAIAISSLMASGAAGAAGMHGSMMSGSMDRYGGPSFKGSPNLAATVAFVMAGGGPAHFSFQKALVSMAGDKTIDQEVGKLETQYGKANVMQWLKTWNFAVADSLRQAKAAGVTLPAAANLHGKDLAVALVKAGLTSNGTFWTGFMLDHVVSNKIHDGTMNGIDAKYGQTADANYHKITNQAMYDLAHALGATTVKLASYH